MKRNNDDANAERNGPFIFEFLRQVFGPHQDYLVSNTQHTNIPNNNQRGLYMFYIETGSIRYPIYVGVTGRSFRTRFLEHRNGGIIHLYNQANGGFPQNIPFQQRHQYPLNVICVPLSFPVAKFIESVFLVNFDFCLNREENGNVRINIDLHQQYDVHESRPEFHIGFSNLKEELENVFVNYQTWYLNG